MKNLSKYFLLIILFGSIYYYINYNNNNNRDYLLKNGVSTIGKVYKISSRRSFTHLYYFYVYNGKKIESLIDIDFEGEKYINRYFEVILVEEDPYNSLILLDKEINNNKRISKFNKLASPPPLFHSKK